MRVYQFRHFGKQAANLIAIFLLAKFISNKVEKSDINFLFITFISFEQLITMKNLGVFIGLVFFSMISYSQMTMALMKELVVQDGVHYLKGVEFSGIAFKKNEKGKFITERFSFIITLYVSIISCSLPRDNKALACPMDILLSLMPF